MAYRRSPASSARSGSCGRTTRPLAVVLQVALDDRLDEQRVVGLAPAGARPGRGRRAEHGAVLRRAGVRHRVRQQPAAGAHGGGQVGQRPHQAISANAAAAASSVRATCSGVWAREGNHASNCDGGA